MSPRSAPTSSAIASWSSGAEEGVDTSAVKRSPIAHTGLYFVTHGPDGHVFSYMRAGSAASRMTPDDMPEAMIKGARVLHASGISQAISSSAADAVFAAMRMARAARRDGLLRHQPSPSPLAARPGARRHPRRRCRSPTSCAPASTTRCTSPASPTRDEIVDFYLGHGREDRRAHARRRRGADRDAGAARAARSR